MTHNVCATDMMRYVRPKKLDKKRRGQTADAEAAMSTSGVTLLVKQKTRQAMRAPRQKYAVYKILHV